MRRLLPLLETTTSRVVVEFVEVVSEDSTGNSNVHSPARGRVLPNTIRQGQGRVTELQQRFTQTEMGGLPCCQQLTLSTRSENEIWERALISVEWSCLESTIP